MNSACISLRPFLFIKSLKKQLKVSKATSQEIFINRPDLSLYNGESNRWHFIPSNENLALSVNHSSFKDSFNLGSIRTTSLPLLLTIILLPKLSKISIELVLFNSHGRALKA